MRVHSRGVLLGWYNLVLLTEALLMWLRLFATRRSWLERVEFFRSLTVPVPLDLAYYMK